MGRDASRDEVLRWCAWHCPNFRRPLHPPPPGWMWAIVDDERVLMPMFRSEAAHVTQLDVENYQGGGAA